jgi:hypothetical protein
LYNGASSLVFKSWAKFLRLFLELINGNLPDKHREILRRLLVSGIAHSHVGLVCESELLISAYVIDISGVVFLDGIFAALAVLGAALTIGTLSYGLDLLDQVIVLVEEFVGVDPSYDVNGDVRSFVLETTMDIDMSVD